MIEFLCWLTVGTHFVITRRSANLILNLFSLMVDANVPDIALEPDKTVKKVSGMSAVVKWLRVELSVIRVYTSDYSVKKLILVYRCIEGGAWIDQGTAIMTCSPLVRLYIAVSHDKTTGFDFGSFTCRSQACYHSITATDSLYSDHVTDISFFMR